MASTTKSTTSSKTRKTSADQAVFHGNYPTSVRMSETKKLPGPSWSLEAKRTCPGSKGEDGELVDACKECYATDGNYQRETVKAPRLSNQIDWKRDDWVSDVVDWLYEYSRKEESNNRSPVIHFRWFDSGDCYALPLARKICEVVNRTPWVNHWMPTRMHKFEKFASIFEKLTEKPNFSLRFSSDSITGEVLTPGKAGDSTIIPDKEWFKEGTPQRMIAEDIERKTLGAGVFICPAYKQEGKCQECRMCWNKKCRSIAYVSHGRKAKKLTTEKINALLP